MGDSISQSFTVVVDESILVNLQARKDAVLRFIKKNFREGIDYIEQERDIGQKQHGGHNRKDIKMTDDTYNLLLSTYNLKHKYVQAIDKLQIKTILMSVENSTIGFICNCLKTSGF